MRPDGRQLAVGGGDGVIRLYDPSTGRLQQALFGQLIKPADVSLAWSPDGKRLASCYLNGPLHIWNTATGQLIHRIPPNSGDNNCVAWSPDGKLLAFSTSGGVTLWDTESWKQVPFQVQAPNVKRLAWSPDSKVLAAGGNAPDVVRLWEVPSAKLLHMFDGFKAMVTALAWSPDGKTLAAVGLDENLCRLWDVSSGKLLRTLELQRDEGLRTVAYSPDGKILAVAGQHCSFVKLFDTETGKELHGFGPGINSEVKSLAWSPDGGTIAATIYRHVSIFDVKTGKEVRRIEDHPHTGYPAWSGDGKKIAAFHTENGGWWRGVRIWDVDSGTQLHRIESSNGSRLSWSPHGTSLAVCASGQVHIFNGENGQHLRSWYAPVSEHCPAWSPDGKLLAAAAADKTVQVWAAASGRLVHTLKGHTANVNEIAWSPDGKRIASGSQGDRTVRLWDASSGKQLHSFDAPTCLRLAWSPDGQSLASGTWGDTRTWDMATQELQVLFDGQLLGWSADSKSVMTWGRGMMRWWDCQTGELVRRTDFPFPDWPILSPNGQYVAVNKCNAPLIGDVSRGKFELTLVLLRGGDWLALRPDGHYRGSPGVEKEIVYIVQTDEGQQVLTPDEFATKYGWKNDPQRVRLTRK